MLFEQAKNWPPQLAERAHGRLQRARLPLALKGAPRYGNARPRAGSADEMRTRSAD